MARDQDEAAVIVEAALQTQPLADVYDTVLIPALSYAKEDRQRGILTATDVQDLVQATREIVEDLATHPSGAALDAGVTAEEHGAARVPGVPVPLLGCPARGTTSTRWRCVCSSRPVIPRVWRSTCCHPGCSRPTSSPGSPRPSPPSSVLAPSCQGVPHLRYLCKQLRARFPALPIVVGCWGAPEPVAETVALLRAEGLDHIGTTVQSTRDHIMHVRQLWPPSPRCSSGG